MINIYECLNEEDCGWVGEYSDAVVFKHDLKCESGLLMCPQCNEVVEKREGPDIS